VDEIEPETPVYARILREYEELMAGEQARPLDEMVRHPDAEISQNISDLLTTRYTLSDNWSNRHQIYPETEEMNLRRAANDCLFRLKQRKVEKMIERLQEELGKPELSEEQQDDLLKEQRELDKAKAALAQYFGTVISR
jgi:DNA primase